MSPTYSWAPSYTEVPRNKRVDAAAKDAISGRSFRKVEFPRDVKAYC